MANMNISLLASTQQELTMASLRRLLWSRVRPQHQRFLSTTTGYQSIGSFHSENPQELLEIPSNQYEPPPLPFEDDTACIRDYNNSDHSFLLDPRWTFLNHGAFGAALKCGHVRAQAWRDYLERQPLRFFDRDLLPHLVYSTRRLASFMNTKPTNLVLLPNTTTGMNAVIQGYVREYKQDAKIVLWETSYGSVKKMARTFCDKVHEVSFLSAMLDNKQEDPNDIICGALEKHLADNSDETFWKNALLVVDHTASNTALNFPIFQLSEISKRHGMILAVDGAHGLLAQPVEEVLPLVDIYVSNGHKWLSCPRGVAVMYCACPDIQETILKIPAVVSHGVDDGFFNRFVWDGTRDYAAALSIPPVVDHWETMGVEAVRQRMHTTLRQAVVLLSDMWHEGNLEASTLAPLHMHSPMALVRLPAPFNCGEDKTSDDAKRIQDYLYSQRIEAPIKAVNGILYVRLSCHVYNTLADYERLGKAILEYPIRS